MTRANDELVISGLPSVIGFDHFLHEKRAAKKKGHDPRWVESTVPSVELQGLKSC